MAKAQAALEFILIFSFFFFIFVVFFGILQERISEGLAKRVTDEIRAEATVISREFQTASVMEDGFQKIITLPVSIQGRKYALSLYGGDRVLVTELILRYLDEPVNEISLSLPENIDKTIFTGETKKGDGYELAFSPGDALCIAKKNGKVFVTKGKCIFSQGKSF